MDMIIDHQSITEGIERLTSIGTRAVDLVGDANQVTLNRSFSGVSGLDQLGGGHGEVVNGGAGSAMSVLRSYVEQVEWLSGALSASQRALTTQNSFVARGMDIADEGGAVGAEDVAFPERPRPRFESFTFVPPVVLPAMSLQELAMEFTSTKIGDLVTALRMWNELSSSVAGIAGELHSVAADLGSRNRGEVIEAAISKISDVALAGETFAANAETMSASVMKVSVAKQRGNVEVHHALHALGAIPEPAQRLAAERAFLMAFPARYTPEVLAGVPPIRNLMVMNPGADGGGEIALGMDEVSGAGAKHGTSGLRAAGSTLEALAALPQAAGSFGAVDHGVEGLSGISGDQLPVTAGDLGTTAATTGTLPLSPSLGGAGGLGAPGTPGWAPTGQPLTGQPTIGAGPLPGQPGSLSQAGTAAAGAGRGMTPNTGVPGGMAGVTGPLAPLGTGARSGRPTPDAQGVAGGLRSHLGGAPAGVAAVGAGGASVGAAASHARGMMPMMGAPMGAAGTAQPGRGSKVKSVVSAVEEDDNTVALLGERRPVVPGVIGAWARG